MKKIVDIQRAGDVGWLLVYSDNTSESILRSNHVAEKEHAAKDVHVYMSFLGLNKPKLNERYVAEQYDNCLGIHAWAEACALQDLTREKLRHT